jgi:hypothetical protein
MSAAPRIIPLLMVARSNTTPLPRCERGRLQAGRLAGRNPISDLRLMIEPCSSNQYPLDPNDELAGDIGAAFAGRVNVGTAISAAKARAAISVFMTRLHIWFVRHLCICAVTGRPALASPKWLRGRRRAVMAITFSDQFRVIQM